MPKFDDGAYMRLTLMTRTVNGVIGGRMKGFDKIAIRGFSIYCFSKCCKIYCDGDGWEDG